MDIAEVPMPEDMVQLIGPAAHEGAALIGVVCDDYPRDIVAAINAYVTMPASRAGSADHWVDRALPLGSLWGEQLRRAFGWQWSGTIFHQQNGAKAFGVVSPDRSLVIYPFHFVFGCFEHHATVTIELAFSMLSAGTIPPFPPRAFQNVMEGVHHIVPP